jgi:copper chaperone CopZ
MDKVLTVPKIRCGGCVDTVEKTLKALPGVERAVASETEKEVRVEFDPAQVSESQLRAALSRAGYPAA